MTGLFEDHLSVDAVVAYVDGELSLTAFQRAAAHVSRCPVCAAEVAEQSFVRDSLRRAPAPPMPGSLAAALFSIPVSTPVQRPQPGLGADPRTGLPVRLPGHRGSPRHRRFRMGAGALIAGLAVGALATAGPSGGDGAPEPVGPPPAEPISYLPGRGGPQAEPAVSQTVLSGLR